MDLVAQVATLYALPLKDFTAARNAAAKEASNNGEHRLAAELRGMRKPSSAAWLTNVLVTRRRTEVEQVLELGDSLRQAQADGDRARLQALGQRRQTLVANVSRQSVEVAAELGAEVASTTLAAVEQTLRAALADPAAAAAVLTGRLVRSLQASGWDAVDLDGAVATPSTGPTGGGSASGDAAAVGPEAQAPAPAREKQVPRRKTEARLTAAHAAHAVAERAVSDARQEALHAAEQRDRVLASITDLEGRLEALNDRLTALDLDVAARTACLMEAERSAAYAEHRIRTAEESIG